MAPSTIRVADKLSRHLFVALPSRGAFSFRHQRRPILARLVLRIEHSLENERRPTRRIDFHIGRVFILSLERERPQLIEQIFDFRVHFLTARHNRFREYQNRHISVAHPAP